MKVRDLRVSLAPLASRIARIRRPLSVKLQSAFLLIIVVVLATAWISLSAIARIERHAVELDKLDQAVSRARELDYSIVAQEHLSSMFVLTAEEIYYRKLLAERERFKTATGQLRVHGVAPLAARIEETFARYERASETVVTAKQAGDDRRAQDIHVAQEHVIAHEIESLTRTGVAQMRAAREAALARIQGEQRPVSWTVGGFFLLAITLAFVFGSLLARSIVYPIQKVDATLERIAAGEFRAVSDVVNQDELGSLVAHVNRMSQQLADLYAKEREATRGLQEQFESLRRAQAQLVQSEKLRALGEMAGGVAHDFNNLLTIVLGQAEFMLMRLGDGDAPPAEVQRRLGLIQHAALDGAETVRRLLEFTRATPRHDEIEAVDVNVLFASVLAVAEPRWKDEAHARGRQIDIVRDFHEVPPVPGNPVELREVLLNLVFNALDAMPDGGTLTVASRANGDAVRLTVSDTGAGIPEEVAARIFEPFFTTKGPQRSGLGLSVSYGIVRRHGGDLSVKSQPGGGATFTLSLPARDVPVPRESNAVVSRAGPRGLRVLIVDDEEFVRQTLRDLCVAAGHHAWEVRSGREALELLRRQPIDLVCTDLGMPDMTGWQVADQIKAAWPDVKVALVTGWGARVEPAELAAHDIDFLMAKPFRAHEVLHILSEVNRAPSV